MQAQIAHHHNLRVVHGLRSCIPRDKPGGESVHPPGQARGRIGAGPAQGLQIGVAICGQTSST